jgi:hypothetical protein
MNNTTQSRTNQEKKRRTKKKVRSGNGRFVVLRDLQDHTFAGKLGFAELGAYYLIHQQADFETGIWTGSAARLRATAPKGGESLRCVQRTLKHLTKIGFLKPFRKRAQRGNYPILINKYQPLVGPHRGMRLNAQKTTDWRNPVWENCTEKNANFAVMVSHRRGNLCVDKSTICEAIDKGVVAEGVAEGVARSVASSVLRTQNTGLKAEDAASAPFIPCGGFENQKEETPESEYGEGVEKTPKMANPASEAWEAIGVKPHGPQKYLGAWPKAYQEHTENSSSVLLSDAMEQFIQECGRQRIKIPRAFYDAKHRIEAREKRREDSTKQNFGYELEACYA